ncbi:MAG: NTP transferase domain-containing protein, partial [Candidatus Omnitrophica bacterium]|nr:NTP transferase domain-containing protein [Candidatus Omnitrophota bacterium]
MQVVILCGGKGTRMGYNGLPKALFPIGDKPILWHIMRLYAHFGFTDFILCTGYKGAQIKRYFANDSHWNVRCVDTGPDTNTGGRIKRIEKYITEKLFFATYGDGLADINLRKLLGFHTFHGK